MDLLSDLEFRGLINQITSRDGLAGRLATGPITLYVGFDPTADSLHIGNFLQILLLRRFQLQGHHPIALAGGGTGLIGDPGGRSGERQLNPQQTVQEWTAKIRSQLERYLDFEVKSNPARIVNNYDWLGELEVIPFLREIGKHFPIGSMLAKESVKSRLDAGISFTEFSYMILQGYDYLRLKEDYGCELQGGGSDQWGNITAGVDLIRRVLGATVHGLTQPLITQADGRKLGKSEGNALWLDPKLTSEYEFYQYWINAADDDVLNFLRFFTFLSPQEIQELTDEVSDRPWKRVAQRTLAREVTTLVHGSEAAASAEKISQALFYSKVSELSAPELEQAFGDVPSYTLRGSDVVELVDLLVMANISPSKRRAREDIQAGAITVNDVRCSEAGRVLEPAERLSGRYIVVRRGKSSYHLVRWEL